MLPPCYTVCVFEMVKFEAKWYGVEVIGSEIIGLTPMNALVDSGKCITYSLRDSILKAGSGEQVAQTNRRGSDGEVMKPADGSKRLLITDIGILTTLWGTGETENASPRKILHDARILCEGNMIADIGEGRPVAEGNVATVSA